MTRHETHSGHDHRHQSGCGHTSIRHDGHTDFLHDGCLHHMLEDEALEHRLDVTGDNPEHCTPDHQCDSHQSGHEHGPGCGHEAVPHGDHVDYLVGDHLHHPHGDHCDDHGPVEVVRGT